MKLQELIDLPVGSNFSYQGELASLTWRDDVRYLITKADPSSKPPTPAVYFKSFALHFTVASKKEGITLVSSYPFPDLLELKEFTK